MLTKENSKGFYPRDSYPTYEYHSRRGDIIKALKSGNRIVPPPKRYQYEVIRYWTVDEDFAGYLKLIEDVHNGISNWHMLKNPGGIFIDQCRNAQWQDEIKRRGLNVAVDCNIPNEACPEHGEYKIACLPF